MAFIIPRLRQQFFRLGNPFLTRPAGVVRVMQRHAADIRLTDQPGRALALAKHFSGNDIFIKRHIQRATHTGVVKRRPGSIEFVVIGRQLRRNVQLVAHGFLQLRKLIDRHRIDNINLPCFVAVDIGGLRRDWQVSHFINNGMRIIPVLCITFSHQPLIHHPLGQLIRAAGDDMLWSGPFIGIPLHQHFVDRYQRRVRQHRQEGGIRLGQSDLQRGVVQRFHPQRLGSLLPEGNLAGVGDMHIARVARVGGGCCRRDQPLPAPDDILRCNGRAVGPGQTGA